jgi:hypothetical protein
MYGRRAHSAKPSVVFAAPSAEKLRSSVDAAKAPRYRAVLARQKR